MITRMKQCHKFSALNAVKSVSLTGDDVVTVNTPAFAESVTEGDVRWEKGKQLSLS